MESVKTQIVKIGNSRGVRIPKLLLDQLDFDRGVEMSVKRGQLVISSAKPVKKVREGWAEAAKEMHENGEDELLLGDFPNQFDEEEWEW